MHSVLYYRMDASIISDYQWSKWAFELVDLQQRYPEAAAKAPLADMFKDFDGSSGFDLPLEDPWAVSTAERLLRYENTRK